MKVEVFGTGCAKCHLLEKHVEEALKETGVQAEVVKVNDIAEIMKRGIIFTPGLAIDGEMKISGRVLSVKELKDLLTAGAK